MTTVHTVTQAVFLRPVLRSMLRITVCRHGGPVRPVPLVLAANHASHLDAPLILFAVGAELPRVAVGAAADYFHGLRAAAVRLLFETFPVHRRGGGLTEAYRRLAAGWTLLLFPEGTRSATGELSPFRPGVAALCLRHRVPCLPIGLTGTYAAMPRGRRWPRPGRPEVTVHVGVPLTPEPREEIPDFTARVSAAVHALVACPGGVT